MRIKFLIACLAKNYKSTKLNTKIVESIDHLVKVSFPQSRFKFSPHVTLKKPKLYKKKKKKDINQIKH